MQLFFLPTVIFVFTTNDIKSSPAILLGKLHVRVYPFVLICFLGARIALWKIQQCVYNGLSVDWKCFSPRIIFIKWSCMSARCMKQWYVLHGFIVLWILVLYPDNMMYPFFSWVMFFGIIKVQAGILDHLFVCAHGYASILRSYC